jgi:large subunit ribosomal protein L17
MRKNVFGRQFKRDANERKALFKNLLTSLVMEEQIKTTEAKAKAIKGAADKLITKAKKGGRDAYRGLEAHVNHNAVVKLIDDLGPRFTSRNGGYTRIVKIRHRVADNAQMAMMEWVEKKVIDAAPKLAKTEKKVAKKAEIKKAEVKVKVEKTEKVEKKSSSAKATEDKAAPKKKTVAKKESK